VTGQDNCIYLTQLIGSGFKVVAGAEPIAAPLSTGGPPEVWIGCRSPGSDRDVEHDCDGLADLAECRGSDVATR
jgi:hypothetical protein